MQSKLQRPIAQYSSLFAFLHPDNNEPHEPPPPPQPTTTLRFQFAEGLLPHKEHLEGEEEEEGVKLKKKHFSRTCSDSTIMSTSSSSADLDGPPDSKRFRMDVTTAASQTSIDSPSVSTTCPVAGGEASQDGQSPAAPSSASYRSSNGSVISASESPIKEEEDVDVTELNDSEGVGGGGGGGPASQLVNNTEIFEMLNKTFGGVFSCDLEGIMGRPSGLLNSPSPHTPSAAPVGIPGAVAVAQSPAAQLFSTDDWSWHRNPAASIRSGGTNKQTPVWKYFVYNKAENLSRCIVGDCTYMLKGPHTSTLACHLKKHTKEYSEFQKLKAEYSRTKAEQQPKIPDAPMAALQSLQTSSSQSSLQNSSVARQTVSPASSISNTNTSSGTTIDLSMKKVKKEPASINEMLLNGFRPSAAQVAAPPAAPPAPASTATQLPVPNFVTNMMLQMNPLHMMLQSLPAPTTPTTPPAALNALQQAGLSLAANGQIVQSKKWRHDEKKQKELAQKLALALYTSHVPFEVLQNPLWKELFEMLQPKFTIPAEPMSEQTAITTSHKLFQAIKCALGGNKKLNLLMDVTKVTLEHTRLTVSVALPSGSGNAYETQVILLAFRDIPQSDNMAEDVANAFEKVLADYKIADESINRVVCSGLAGIVGDDSSNILAKQMESFGARLAACLHNWLQTSDALDALRKNVYAMLFSYLTVPAAIPLASQMLKTRFELPVTEHFHVIIESIVTNRPVYDMGLDGLAPITDSEWATVHKLHQLMKAFKPFIAYSQEMTTVDTVVPTVMQIRSVLQTDVYKLGREVCAELLAAFDETIAPMISPEHEDFDSTYIQATALNPQLAVTLSADQMTLAKSLIEKELTKRTKKAIFRSEKKLAMGVDSLLANVMKSRETDGGGGGGAAALALCGDFLQSMSGEAKENIVNQYFDEISNNSVETIFSPMLRTFGNPMQAPLSYWKSCSSRCSELSELATELLSIPIFTLTAERALTFAPPTSPATQLNANLVLANLDSAEQFEKQMLLRFNRQFVSKLFI